LGGISFVNCYALDSGILIGLACRKMVDYFIICDKTERREPFLFFEK